MADGTRTELLWCSEETALRFEELQLTLGEGPGPDAVRTGAMVWVPDLTQVRAGRWPALAVEAADSLIDDFDLIDFLQQLCVRCMELLDVAAVGILLADVHDTLQTIAASDEHTRLLELFALLQTDPDPLSVMDVTLAQALADVATIAILRQRTAAHSEVERAQLQYALTSRIVLEQVKGILAERWHVSVDDSFAAFRSYARAHHLQLAQLARQITSGAFDTTLIPRPTAPSSRH